MWIKDYIILETKRKELQDKMKPLQDEMSDVISKLNDTNEKLPSEIKKIISDKLWDNISPSEKEKIDDYHRMVSEMMSGNASYTTSSAGKTPFDPRIDKWHIVNFEQDGDNIRFEVSCNKNEGTISGLLTFLDTYWTTWFNISEIENYY